MYDLIVKFILFGALLQLGLTISDLGNCHSPKGLHTLEKRSREVLKIDWKAISIFPEEAKRFR